jgi:hypothetical protein
MSLLRNPHRNHEDRAVWFAGRAVFFAGVAVACWVLVLALRIADALL